MYIFPKENYYSNSYSSIDLKESNSFPFCANEIYIFSYLPSRANFGIFCSTPGIAVSRTVNQKQALYMLLTGNAITADEAVKSGLITRVVSNEPELDAEVDRICDSIKSKSRAIVQRGKKFFYEQNQMTLKSAYKYGEQEMIENISTKDGQEGVQSFIDKRKPIWSHSQED